MSIFQPFVALLTRHRPLMLSPRLHLCLSEISVWAVLWRSRSVLTSLSARSSLSVLESALTRCSSMTLGQHLGRCCPLLERLERFEGTRSASRPNPRVAQRDQPAHCHPLHRRRSPCSLSILFFFATCDGRQSFAARLLVGLDLDLLISPRPSPKIFSHNTAQ